MPGSTKPAQLNAADCSFVIVEDDKLLRDLLKDVLQRRFQPRSIADFDAGRAGLEVCLNREPELLITDLRLPDMDGRDIIRKLRSRDLKTRVVVLTSHVDAVLPAELISLGVAGLVDKSSSLDHVERAVQSVLAGGLYFAASVSPMGSSATARDGLTDDVGPSALSERERAMARLVSQGYRAKEIAERLGLNPRTAEKHRLQLMEKLHLPNTTSLVRWCVRHGLD